jgi:hypothetical protein
MSDVTQKQQRLENTEQLKHMIEEVESLALNDDT